MKQFINTILILISIPFYSCNILNPTYEIDAEFIITDTTGIISRVFHSGEEFDMKLTLTNNTGKDQEYSYTGPIIRFEIIQNDSVITSSIHGLAWPMVVSNGILKKDAEISSSWRAPTPLHASTLITLKPGQYQARAVIWMTFKNYKTIPPQVKEITIIE